MLKGSIVALVTPFNENKEVNYNKLEELLEIQYSNHTDALVILGTTSESSTLSIKEKEEILEFVINKNNKRMKIVSAVISNNTVEAIELSKKYEQMGADYLLVIAPFYNKPNKKGLIKHFESIANFVSIPIIVYNVPSRCGINISCEILQELKKIPNIVGVKESSKDINQIIDVFTLQDDSFSIYCGNDELSYLFLSLGVRGLINVYGNYDPSSIKRLMNKYEIHPLLAREYFYELYSHFKLMTLDTNPIPIKALMNYKGIDVGGHRLPLESLGNDFLQKNNFV